MSDAQTTSATPRLAASMVVIGDEILQGFVTDANTVVLATRLRAHGVELERVHTVPDDAAAIAEALHAECDRGGPRVVVTSGGIGSTPDDLTYEAVAAAFSLDLVTHPLLEERIEGSLRWTADQGFPVDADFRWHMMRMARVPAGAELLDPDGSWAPGLRLDRGGGSRAGGCTICILPGVPSQFRTIVDNAVVPRLVAGTNPVPTVLETTHPFPESTLNPVFARLVEEFPDVKLGSYPGDPMVVRLSGPPRRVGTAMALVEEHLATLRASDHGRRIAAAWSRRLRRSSPDRTTDADADADAPAADADADKED